MLAWRLANFGDLIVMLVSAEKEALRSVMGELTLCRWDETSLTTQPHYQTFFFWHGIIILAGS